MTELLIKWNGVHVRLYLEAFIQAQSLLSSNHNITVQCILWINGKQYV
jgi:hypothetical protein